MNDKLMRELDRRSKLGIRNLRISPLFEKDKYYNIDRQSPNYDKEDPEGHLHPEYNHCWLTWESKWMDYLDSENRVERWSNEAYNFPTIESAERAKEYLEAKTF